LKRNLISAGLALFIGLPGGWVTSMLLTPVLWRLEPVLGLELAGHSGPSDWVFYVIWGLLIPALFFVFRFVIFREP
jgi:hypothetical protein